MATLATSSVARPSDHATDSEGFAVDLHIGHVEGGYGFDMSSAPRRLAGITCIFASR